MDRRTFLRTSSATGLSLAAGCSMNRSDKPTGTGRPVEPDPRRAPAASGRPRVRGVLLFLVDQHRADCLGCYGNPVVRTPTIDALAAGGVRFDRAFTPTALCSPARTCIQTGVLAHRHGLVFNSGHWSRTNGGATDLDATRWPVFASSLNEAGWNLAHLGKWHIGETNRPSDFGYEGPHYPKYGWPAKHPHYLAYLKSLGLEGFKLREEVASKSPAPRTYAAVQEGPAEASVPGYLAHQAIDTLNRFAEDEKPFFISCNFWGPHAPFYITEKHYRMYEHAAIEAWPNFRYDMADKPEVLRAYGRYWGIDSLDEKTLVRLVGRYYGYISLIDEMMGRVLAVLKEKGLDDETLVVFTSDHGSTVGSHGLWDKGFGMYDCPQRIPLVLGHPSLRGRSIVSDEYATLMDLAPTFLEAAGFAPPEHMDGRSLWPVIDKPEAPRRRDDVICEHFGHQQPFWQRMVRTDRTKYIYNAVERDEFYDLEADPHEMHNLIDKASKQELARMKERLAEWIKETKDPVRGWSRNTL